MKTKSANKAFTLIELILALTIFGLVITSVLGTLQAGLQCFKQGKVTLELYQNARISLRKMSEEFRFALASDAFWRPADRYRYMPRDMMMNQMPIDSGGGMVVEEEDPGAIRFLGETNTILYVRKVYHLDSYPPFDLEECRISLDAGNKQIVSETIRSLLAIKQATWFYQYTFKLDLAGQVIPGGPNGRTRLRILPPGAPMLFDFLAQLGNYGMIGKKVVLAEGIEDMKFRFSDGKAWKGNWDSQQIIQQPRISQNSPNFDPSRDMKMTEMGPPSIVEITIKLSNGDTLATATDIPSGDRYRSSTQLGGGLLPPSADNPQAPVQPNQPKSETPANVPR